MNQPIRQGDVILVPVKVMAQDAALPLPHLTLAEGEVTGHSHRISAGDAVLSAQAGALYLAVTSNYATLIHEEHAPIQIPQGLWSVRIQREYEPEGWRAVAD